MQKVAGVARIGAPYRDGGNIALFARRLRLRIGLDRLRFGNTFGDRIDAETILTADADERLGVDGAVEVIVQIRALRHALEKLVERQRIGAHPLQLPRGASLSVTFRAALTGARGQHERSEDQRPKADRIERETFAVELSNNHVPRSSLSLVDLHAILCKHVTLS
jgi:hypothetical protein